MADTQDRLVIEEERRLLTTVSRSKWFVMERAGLAPRRVSIPGSRKIAWKLSELQRWIADLPRGGAR